MTFRIPRGKHRAWPFSFGIWWRKKSFSWVVKFTESCRYDLQNNDQLDTNKLIGIGYLPGHHEDSARFGWLYNVTTGLIEMSAYCYLSGRRITKDLASCEIGKEYLLELFCLNGAYHFSCYEKGEMKNITAEIVHGHSKNFKYRLGVFFGGNQKAPHEIKIQLNKV
jgi:hypothetical protein